MNKLIAGAIAGTVATVPMTAVMVGMHRSISRHEKRTIPPKQVTDSVANRIGAEELVDEESELQAATSISHLAYGAAAGAAYAAVESGIRAPAAAKGILFGLTVWAGSYLGWLPLFGIRQSAVDRPASENAMMIASHVVYGAVLGRLLEGVDDE